ncbi:MAG: FtsX-like permease family protein [Chitinophagaceae bacterium]|nr:MAG: FtsX-like permease family protein [Chitinophagaceae bacterium]
MLKNYFKTAFRSFLKNKVITIITVAGLAIGISAVLVIYQIVQYDYNFDKYEPDGNRIYRIVSQGPNWNNSGVPSPLHEAVQRKIAGIQTTAAFFEFNDWNTKVSIPQGNNQSPKVFKKQQDIVFADSSYFDIFPHQWLAGNATASLNTPYQLVLSESRAKLYFPNLPLSQIIGKTVVFNDTINTVISGIVKDLMSATDFNNKEFIALSTIPNSGLKPYYNWDQWGNTNSVNQLFVKLTPGISPQQINVQLKNIFKASLPPDEFNDKEKHFLQPLSDIHFNTAFDGKASKSTLHNLILLAIFLLLLGAINFINLSTAQASQRAKEVGVRKTLGSSKGQLISQFLTETFLLTVLATILSVLITPLLLKIFSGYTPAGLKYAGLEQPHVIIFLGLLIGVVSLLSGIYPALIMTKFNPVTAMKNASSSNISVTRSAWIRKTLIITQFIVAQIFIISVLMVNKQIHYSISKDMGFRKDGIINFYLPFDFYHPNNKKFVLKDELQYIPGIQIVSLGNQSPAFHGTMTTTISYKEGKKEMTILPDMRSGDTNYLKVYHIKLLAGRNVLPADSVTELLINETLAERLGFKRPFDAIGKFLTYNGSDVPVVGVMADFNESGVRRAIQPLIFFYNIKYGYVMHIALQPNVSAWPATIAQIKKDWQSVYPDQDFDYTFLDKTIANFYKRDIKLSKLLAWAAGIAIFIGCLGLLGLVIFMANQRTKEIGIRKVLGATVMQIITLLSKDFMLLVGLAFIMAVPVAWIAMNKWLQNFAYHTALSWWIFIAGGTIMLVFALIILCIRAGRAAMANPVEALRSE